MNGADLIAEILKKEGVEFIPAFPHSDILDSAARIGIRPIIVRQERQALHIADGYSRMNAGRKIGCTTVQYGPGSENAMGAVAQCHADNVPVLHLPGGYPRDEARVAPNFLASRNMQHINKWCETVPHAGRIPQMMQNAFAILRNGRPGPVTLEVPIDIFTGEVESELADAYQVQSRSTPVADISQISELAGLLLKASHPLIIAGQGILYAQASEELVHLAELANIPVASTLNGKSAFPENHPLSLGCAGGARPDPVNHFLDKADLIIGLGTSFTRSDYITPFPTRGKTLVQLTNYEGDLSKDYPVELGILGDAKPTLAALARILSSHADKLRNRRQEITSEVREKKARFIEQWLPLLSSDEEPINPYRVIRDLMHTVDRSKTVITHDAGSPRDQLTPFWESIVPHGYIGWGKTTQLGMGLGLVQGAKLAKPDWSCLNIMGDAAIGMVGMDLETGVRCGIPTLTIVFKNSVMGGYTHYHPVATEKYDIHQLGGDYADLAMALGAYGERVEKVVEIIPAIKRGLNENARGRPALIEVITKEESRMAKNLPDLS